MGTAFLTRVRESVRDQAALFAVDATRDYVGGRLPMRVLGASKDARAVAVLAGRLDGKSPQPPVVSALEEIGSTGKAELVASLGKERADRRVICQASGKVGTQEALPALRGLAKSSDRPVADAARAAAESVEGRKE